MKRRNFLLALLANIPLANVQAKSDVSRVASGVTIEGLVNVKDFGAVADGIADDTNAIKSALNILEFPNDTTPVTVFFPKGHYKFLGSLNLTCNKRLVGVSENWGSRIRFYDKNRDERGGITLDGNVAGSTNGWSFQNTIENFVIDYGSDGSKYTNGFLKIGKTYNSRLSNIWFFNNPSERFAVIDGGNNNLFQNIRIWGEGRPEYAIEMRQGSLTIDTIEIEGYGRDSKGTNKGGAISYKGGSLSITGLYIERTTVPISLDNGLVVNNKNQLTVTGGIIRGEHSGLLVSVHASHNVKLSGIAMNMTGNHGIYVYYSGKTPLHNIHFDGVDMNKALTANNAAGTLVRGQVADLPAIHVNGRRWGTAAPTSGKWAVGDEVFNLVPNPRGWVYTGKWEAF